jgi:ketosteroid isomerase-like protein
MAGDLVTQSEIESTIETFFSLVSARNMKVLDEFAAGRDVLLVGSDEGEIARGIASIEAFFSKIFARPHTHDWHANRLDVCREGEIAWFFAEGEMTIESADGQEKGPYYISGVMERRGERWYWRQYHGSEPAPVP